MYQLISALAKPVGSNGRWVSVNIGDIKLQILFSTFTTILAELTNPFLTNTVAFNLEQLRYSNIDLSITFSEYLLQNNNKTLDTSDNFPIFKTKYAKYADAFHAGYKIQPIHPTAAADALMPLAEKTSLHLTRPNTDYQLFHKSCLVSVNGFFHMVDSDVNGIYVKDGMKSAFLSGENQLGIYSFNGLGAIRCKPITPAMVFKQSNQQYFKDRVFVTLDEDVSNKTVMLVLGGYLHVLDKQTFFRINGTSFGIDFSNIQFLDRYFESKKYLDFSSLSVEETSRNKNQVSISNMYSDETLLAYLTLSQSFFVILDNTNIFVNRIPVASAKLPDLFVGYSIPKYPMFVGAGKNSNYWYTFEDGQYSLACHDTLLSNRLYETVNPGTQVSVSDQRVSENPISYGSAYFLEIGADI